MFQKNQNISKTKQDIEKLKTPLRFVWKCCSDALKIGSTIFHRRGTLKYVVPLSYHKNPVNGEFGRSCQWRIRRCNLYTNYS